MMVMEKNRDIAVLMSMGARQRQVWAIFTLHGLLIGAMGTALGLVLGYGSGLAGRSLQADPARRADLCAVLGALSRAALRRPLDRARRARHQLPGDALSVPGRGATESRRKSCAMNEGRSIRRGGGSSGCSWPASQTMGELRAVYRAGCASAPCGSGEIAPGEIMPDGFRINERA